MNFVRSRLSIGSLLGQRCRQITQTWSHRGMCIKPQEVKGQTPSEAHAPRPEFKVPGYRPNDMDKKILLWSGRFKTAEQIPEFVSFEMIDAARNRLRVKACYAMIVFTLGSCLLMVILGKRAAGRHETLSNQNLEKKAKLKEELEKDGQGTLALAPKAQ
ncbi:protein FAM162B [Anabas testudineus]|uniref:Family with sequence similarity 162 member A n=1 Tax=Anabas testudineus TaxID=64144 RepID=A0A7N6BEJ7_ANATE|nr:protein FAM162B [Anabas testudineus]